MKPSSSDGSKKYDLEERTLKFAKGTRVYLKGIRRNPDLFEDCKQLTRSSGSVGANYIEANEALSKKDFVLRIKICRKEAKESIYWLRLLSDFESGDRLSLNKYLEQEATELMKIFGAILEKCK